MLRAIYFDFLDSNLKFYSEYRSSTYDFEKLENLLQLFRAPNSDIETEFNFFIQKLAISIFKGKSIWKIFNMWANL